MGRKCIITMILVLGLFSYSACTGGEKEDRMKDIPVSSEQFLIDIEIDYSRIDLVSSFHAGVTHTQNSPDIWKNATAVANAKVLLESSTEFQNQHIMGWGALNPWPDSSVTDPSKWDWESLDGRIKLIRDTKGIPVITLCGCPTWMHSPSSNGTTVWGTSLEKAPTLVHYDDFAHLCAEVARRYPDVIYYQVWNELKGFWNLTLNRWNYEGYTSMYNMIYDSLKKVNTSIKIGGPYPVVSTYSTQKSFISSLGGAYGFFDKRPMDVISYWLAHKHGADFICIDGKLQNKDDILNCDIFRTPVKFRDIISWINKQNEQDPLEIWWAEWYAVPDAGSPQRNADFDNALMASAMIRTIKAGSSVALIWQPEGDELGFSFPLGFWTSTASSNGGSPTKYYNTSKIFKKHFSKGAKLVSTRCSSENVNVIATDSKILLVNHRSVSSGIRINSTTNITLEPFEVRLIDADPNQVISSGDAPKIWYDSANQRLQLNNLKTENDVMNWTVLNQSGVICGLGNVVVSSEFNIDLHSFPSGVFFYRIIYGDKVYSNSFL